MSALYRGVCYPSVEAARQQTCSASSVTWGDGSSVFTSECVTTDFTAPSMQICKREDGGPCITLTQQYPPFPACEHSGGVDLAADWLYLVLPTIVILWGIKRIIGLFDNNREDA